jgi:hypothetical protein
METASRAARQEADDAKEEAGMFSNVKEEKDRNA